MALVETNERGEAGYNACHKGFLLSLKLNYTVYTSLAKECLNHVLRQSYLYHRTGRNRDPRVHGSGQCPTRRLVEVR